MRRRARRADASARPGTAEPGYLHCGPTGAGHFVKMVHNGIEYGLMAAYAEGLNILRHANVGNEQRDADAETTPLREPEFYRYDIDTTDVAEVWRRGSVIGSWLLDLTAAALLADPDLDGFQGRVSDSGEGRWTLLAAVDEGVPAHVLSAALFDRFESRGEAEFAEPRALGDAQGVRRPRREGVGVKIADSPEWAAVAAHADVMRSAHLRGLFADDPHRAERLSAEAGDLFLDYSKHVVTDETIESAAGARPPSGPA